MSGSRSRTSRERAAFELRAWQHTGQHGLGEVAWRALFSAALRLGYASVEAASHDGRSAELYSEAIEDVESED